MRISIYHRENLRCTKTEKEEIPRYLVRQQVRPGITGLAQVNGFRGDTSIEERVKYDIEYIERWTIGFDLRIIWRTVFGAMVNEEKVGGGDFDGVMADDIPRRDRLCWGKILHASRFPVVNRA